MKLFLVDLETTSLDAQEGRILEHGYILWDTKWKKPLGMSSSFWFDETYPNEWTAAEKINSITYEHIKQEGHPPKVILTWLEKYLEKHNVDYLVAHNGKSFDHPFLKKEVERAGLQCPRIVNTPLIDTRTDLPFNPAPRSRHIGHLAYDYGIVHDPNEKHSAIFDCQLMYGLLRKFDIEQVLKYANAKNITLRAHCDFHTKELAKSCGYSFFKPQNHWLKTIKEFELDAEVEKAKQTGFEVSQI